jgi:hypothetical protein
LLVFISFGGVPAWFLIAQARLFQQPSATRDRVLHVVGFFEIRLNERRRVDADLARWVVNGVFECFLLIF